MVKKKNKKDKNGLMITFNNERKSVLSGESWVYTDSLNLAEVLNTEHKEVLKRIRKVLKDYRVGAK
ncbi:Rha family transcriptional regulator [Clostridium botulinum]|uniref:Rha family transcriptional regulator n=1 Tax=Clostridium botulinum TaxID=1491 RepID=UPI001E42DFE4|nr:Rha family transcriptional regulator [Clostridium botulinum]